MNEPEEAIPDNPSAPAGKSRRYARREFERRFLLDGLPEEPAIRVTAIIDHYLTGTRLRVRAMTERDATGERTFYKLTQKIPSPSGRPGLISTIYLDAAEHQLLSSLPSQALHKTRHSIPPFGVDVFGPPLDVLVLAEFEADSDEALAAAPIPPRCIREVTTDERFTGGRLVTTTSAALRDHLVALGVTRG